VTESIFWRNADMPYVELRRVEDGRNVSYAPHSHKQWSIGAITHGISTFQYRDDLYPIKETDLVMMNPDWVHTCNPVDNQPWAYLMMYVDADWLTQLRFEAGLIPEKCWQDIHQPMITLDQASNQTSNQTLSQKEGNNHWYSLYCEVAGVLISTETDLLEKQSCFIDYITTLMSWFSDAPQADLDKAPAPQENLNAVAEFLDQSLATMPTLENLTTLANCSEGHLIRSFRRQYGLTPHAYLLNRRIQKSRELLQQGMELVDVAQQLAFSDQAHFQRTFKKLTATTPGQYQNNRS
jgi:AraC-like DNA-binding protein